MTRIFLKPIIYPTVLGGAVNDSSVGTVPNDGGIGVRWCRRCGEPLKSSVHNVGIDIR